MNFALKDGNWPVMITFYTEDNQIDYYAMERLINWYKSNGMDGLFAVSQSSEMFHLSLPERVELARFVKAKAGTNVQVIASGHISDTIENQIEEIKQISATGIDAFVLVSNRLATAEESDEVFKQNIKMILHKIPGVNFGIYECPYPYKRLVSPNLLKWLADTERFFFLKDTCCDLKQINERVGAVKGTNLKIFNANTATLLESYRLGVSGFSGVMANFHPELYDWLSKVWKANPEQAQEIQAFLGMASIYELQQYPVNAKYNLLLEGIGHGLQCRSKNAAEFDMLQKIAIEQLRTVTKLFKDTILSKGSNPF
ncbi:dihydrodipicolinate synthase family protein [Neobacillus vireti]|uniref:Dihydrodipicolinate synthetase n=1 Tax=Neobacillus vireti LMG 21834 TaxID=1131730 RepID=A0AB94IT80_9BACI|nr:dihydrodipicolinate synthase family protein [Neobacillus vireti]ETI70163.1 dihydrodipicolinate synthetase [Neobacillus vireti LMG 21834]KLT16468.1 dihydrodipicolinate synthetase [Neobacillus vireti]